ncbi:MAG: biopolymer transporter ExbD [Planctomycetaceae bacterium]|nr:biopolymer transporter ExbD [Planctomycetaceae bacterium]
MPIQFRCQACRQRLSITSRKAGLMVACPACGEQIQVPKLEDTTAKPPLTPERREETPAAPTPLAETEPLRQSTPSPEEFAQENDRGTDRFATEAAITQQTHPHVETQEEEGGFHVRRRTMDDDGLDMTPMVDVTFLLLIFFMITASFSLQKSMETEAPEPEKEGFAQMPNIQDLADESVIVEIDENDSIFVDDEPVGGLGELEDVLRRKMSGEQKLEMIIEPHYQAKHGTVVAVTDSGVTVGMQRIRRVSKSEQ